MGPSRAPLEGSPGAMVRCRRAITLLEMMVALISASVILGAMGSLFAQAIWSYRNAQMITTGYISQGNLDTVMRAVLMAAPNGSDTRKLFNTLPSVADDGTILQPRAFAYEAVTGDNDAAGSPPSATVATNNQQVLTGIVVWYRARPYPGQLWGGANPDGNSEGNQFMESTIYWFESLKSQMTARYLFPKDSFIDFTAAEVMAFFHAADPRYRRASKALSQNVSAFALDWQDPVNGGVTDFNVRYRMSFQTQQDVDVALQRLR